MSAPLNLHSNTTEVIKVGGKTLQAVKYTTGAPSNGTAGFWPGALYFNVVDAKYYKNTGTAASATWTEQTT